MRLQRLEIAGFKSFPDRSELSFEHGVTAIVGPNGCGKSNVVDAITWVLGEQSARSLRGDSMADVIFSGSDARKPTAAAEVRLRLAGVTSLPGVFRSGRVVNGHGGGLRGGNGNAGDAASTEVTEHEQEDVTAYRSIAKEIEIARRLYRSGESEYLIDGEVCRLRDVQDLLMDGGLGTKGYAVIEQGKIGQILSARPTDRRQLIEEAAGVTKYKTRRRAAELKLEAAQQNLTRIDDIVFEIEKQRGALKRQAAKTRRYRRLREQLRKWEKALFARRYRTLADTIESASVRLQEARALESAAAGRVASAESRLERLRIEITESDAHATAAREAAHACELEIGRRQQQIEFGRQQVAALGVTVAEIAQQLQGLEARREPGRIELASRRDAASRAVEECGNAARMLATAEENYVVAHGQLEGLESDVEAARSEVFAAINSATALRHAIENTSTARDKIGMLLTKLEIESSDLGIEAAKIAADREAATLALRNVRAAMEATRVTRAERESELKSMYVERERREREAREREQDLAGLSARLASLEELAAVRADYADAARIVLAEARDITGHHGSVADAIEVDRGYERAVEAALGDLLQHVIVSRRHQAEAGLRFVRERNAGRCGFLVADEHDASIRRMRATARDGLKPLSSVVRVDGPYASVVADSIGEAWIADSFDSAARAARSTSAPIVTLAGDVFHGPQRVSGGVREEVRGILATKGEMNELRERIVTGRELLRLLGIEIEMQNNSIAEAEGAIAALDAEQHRQEKAIVGFEMQLQRAAEETERLGHKQNVVAMERRQADEERGSLEARQAEARQAVMRIEHEQRVADERFNAAQRRLFDAREAAQVLAGHVAEAKAAFAALVERASAVATEVRRLEEAVGELEARIEAGSEERRRTETRKAELEAATAEAVRLFGENIKTFEELRDKVRLAEEHVADLHASFETEEAVIREARRVLEQCRAAVVQLEIQRATAEADLVNLANSCVDTLQATLDEVAAEVSELDRKGETTPEYRALEAEDETELEQEAATPAGSVQPVIEKGSESADTAATETTRPITAEEMIARLRRKLDQLGSVNMMAVEQFDELEARHAFLTTQREDLRESIARTGEAIRRIDRTTRERFREAFDAINTYFQATFATLFGGGRAGLVLLDENDLLESGIDIIAQPPGKRLQSVMLLSGGEKALTAIALMFGIFTYRPSPFCLLDEIDAPLDDANIGRFIEMLQGMQTHTQFILITHNRKTMEIADRLYGVTMEEPGVSKLISVQLN